MKPQNAITPQRARAIFEALRLLASFDGDRARELNGQGFNKADGATGHRLANSETLSVKELEKGLKLARKYRRQLPEYLCDQLQLSS